MAGIRDLVGGLGCIGFLGPRGFGYPEVPGGQGPKKGSIPGGKVPEGVMHLGCWVPVGYDTCGDGYREGCIPMSWVPWAGWIPRGVRDLLEWVPWGSGTWGVR